MATWLHIRPWLHWLLSLVLSCCSHCSSSALPQTDAKNVWRKYQAIFVTDSTLPASQERAGDEYERPITSAEHVCPILSPECGESGQLAAASAFAIPRGALHLPWSLIRRDELFFICCFAVPVELTPADLLHWSSQRNSLSTTTVTAVLHGGLHARSSLHIERMKGLQSLSESELPANNHNRNGRTMHMLPTREMSGT